LPDRPAIAAAIDAALVAIVACTVQVQRNASCRTITPAPIPHGPTAANASIPARFGNLPGQPAADRRQSCAKAAAVPPGSLPAPLLAR
ncbi:hypothetical protein, partial [Desulfolutivibrio sulfodismutans]|uniref:hypothetical protein n=1 Tax=Desulfolutivibrio sulfodismutans TaxID=63561 RepID=UPI001BA8CE0D